jgi:hypothetical protein
MERAEIWTIRIQSCREFIYWEGKLKLKS